MRKVNGNPPLEVIKTLIDPKVEDSTDVWMRDLMGERDLVLQSLQGTLVAGQAGVKGLECHGLPEELVLDFVDFSHRANPNRPSDQIARGDHVSGPKQARAQLIVPKRRR